MTNTQVAGGALAGSSGATLELVHGGGSVLKRGDDRVTWQGEWLYERRGNPALPRVSDRGPGWYVMDRLTPIPAWARNTAEVADEMYRRLRDHVWSSGGDLVPFSAEAHVDKLYSIAGTNLALLELVEGPMLEAYSLIDWLSLRPAVTHGDPTFDNTMLARDGGLVFIDPLPSSGAVPDLECVDVGKILQSAVGYEWVRFARKSLHPAAMMHLRRRVNNENEWTASLYWCAVHLLRAIPYMPTEEVKDALVRKAHAVLPRVGP